MSLHLYNTLSRQKEKFVPADPNRLTMYVCGPTVYSYAHIGNARPAVIFDVLVKLLRHQWPQVIFARNITDIDDKINAAASKEGVEINVISRRFTSIYHDDMMSLGIDPPDLEPHATDHVPDMITMIERLISGGHAYHVDGHVLFNVPTFANYGHLSGHPQEELRAGARVDVAPYKKDPSDFILWKPSAPEMPGWDSPWGRGRPGWHLECSAMIEKHLGETIDIHGGGIDLVFPHHENEIAQSTCVHGGKTFVRYWLHNGFVNVEKEKMSKSIGNVLLIRDLLEDTSGEAIRLALLAGHYRQPLDWTDNGLQQAEKMLDRLYGTVQRLADIQADDNPDPDPDFLTAMNDDLNTPRALAALFELVRLANTAENVADKRRLKGKLLRSAGFLGLLQQTPDKWFAGSVAKDNSPAEDEIQELVQARNRARETKNFAEADRIRDLLGKEGIVLDDGAVETRWRRR